MRTKRQLMLDAHTLGAIMRNIAAIADIVDRRTPERAATIMRYLMARYNAGNPQECLDKINRELMEGYGETIN
jgi:hypothetical protein